MRSNSAAGISASVEAKPSRKASMRCSNATGPCVPTPQQSDSSQTIVCLNAQLQCHRTMRPCTQSADTRKSNDSQTTVRQQLDDHMLGYAAPVPQDASLYSTIRRTKVRRLHVKSETTIRQQSNNRMFPCTATAPQDLASLYSTSSQTAVRLSYASMRCSSATWTCVPTPGQQLDNGQTIVCFNALL